MKRFLGLLLIASLVFLVVYLYKNNMLFIPQLINPIFFFISLLLILIGFLLDTIAWRVIMKKELPAVTFTDAFISSGKFIFSKYIPGKLWIILGKAGYIQEKYNFSFVNLTSYSFYYQLISLFAATMLGIGIVYKFNLLFFWILIVFAGLFILLFVVFHKSLVTYLSRIYSSLFRKGTSLPNLLPRTILKIFIISFTNWLIWSVAFYFFLYSAINEVDIQLSSGLLFPVSSVIGIVVIIAPGGLGVREGFLTLGLIGFGLSSKEAASIAVLSRIWFLIGEFIFFISALIMFIKNKYSKANA